VAKHRKHYFLHIQSKSDSSNPAEEQDKSEFDIKKMKDYELTSETFDVLFKEFTVIDFLEDDPIQYNWDGFYRKMENEQEFGTELQFNNVH
jgi:hypothetical protein